MSSIGRALIYKETPQGALVITPYLPDDWTPEDARAGIVFFFGGGWATGTPAQFSFQAKALADRGMVCFCADYRVMSRHEVLAPSCVEDGKSAIRWLRQHARILGLDPQRLAAGGGSAGGHVAACAGVIAGFDDPSEDLSVPSVPDALVLFNPALDVTFEPQIADRFGGEFIAERFSPLSCIAPGLPPSWIAHGTEDSVIPIRQTRQFVSQMQACGNQAVFFQAEGVGHGFFNHAPWAERTLESLLLFLQNQSYVTPRSQPARDSHQE